MTVKSHLISAVLPFGVVLSLTACMTAPTNPGSDACHSERVGPWIGHVATSAVRDDIAKATRADPIRWLYPDSVVTMDFRGNRLNVTMDKGTDVIRSAKCG